MPATVEKRLAGPSTASPSAVRPLPDAREGKRIHMHGACRDKRTRCAPQRRAGGYHIVEKDEPQTRNRLHRFIGAPRMQSAPRPVERALIGGTVLDENVRKRQAHHGGKRPSDLLHMVKTASGECRSGRRHERHRIGSAHKPAVTLGRGLLGMDGRIYHKLS